MEAKSVFEVLAQYGITGVMLFVVGYAYYRKDKALTEEQQSRIEDAKAFNTMAMELQKQVITAVNKLSDLVETWEKREHDRELREQLRGPVRREGGPR